jgi:hypothetical protein
MYSLDKVIKEFKSIINIYKKSNSNNSEIIINYYETIIGFMLIENKHKDIVEKCGKPIYHYFKYNLPQSHSEYFYWLYNNYSSVRFSIETFDSIEEVREDIRVFYEKRNKL